MQRDADHDASAMHNSLQRRGAPLIRDRHKLRSTL